MRRTGSITRWIDDRGFDFVTADDGGEEAFLHISALPRRAVRPMVGDRISYEVRLDLKGRPQAVRVSHAGEPIAVVGRTRERTPDAHTSRNGRSLRLGLMGLAAGLLAVVALGWFLLHPAPREAATIEPPHRARARLDVPVRQHEPAPLLESRFETSPTAAFACEGKTHCSQMRSCDEAMFYLRNCPGSVTDGDGDGRPCEDQWCGH